MLVLDQKKTGRKIIIATFEPSIETYDLNTGKLLWRFYLKEKNNKYFRYGGKRYDYSGGNPNSDGTWTELSVTLDTDTSSWVTWTDSGNVDLSSYAGGNVYIAFKYVSTSSGSATYEIDNVLLIGE